MLRKAMDADTAVRETGAALAETEARLAELRKQVAAQSPRIVTQSRVLPNQYSVERLNTMLAELENRRTQALMKFRPEERIVIEKDGKQKDEELKKRSQQHEIDPFQNQQQIPGPGLRKGIEDRIQKRGLDKQAPNRNRNGE